jgi:hypothetical protein
MSLQKGIKFKSMLEFWEYLPENERIVVDVLRQIILKHLPSYCKEKLSYNVPYYYGKRRICLIWPGSVPWGGIREGVLFGFCYGNRLKDANNYLTHGTNKQVFYKIYYSPDEINYKAIVSLLKEAVEVDNQFK